MIVSVDYKPTKEYNASKVESFLMHRRNKLKTFEDVRFLIKRYCAEHKMKMPDFRTVDGRKYKEHLLNLFNIDCQNT